MKAITLTDKQYKQIIEMCETLYPTRVFMTWSHLGEPCFIKTWVRGTEGYGKANILHWYELCTIHIPQKMGYKGKLVMSHNFFLHSLEAAGYSKSKEPTHPVDYLYREFQKFKRLNLKKLKL